VQQSKSLWGDWFIVLAIYPGSFDPVTNGHLDIIDRATALFDQVRVVILYNPAKTGGLFSIEERLAMLKDATRDRPAVHVDSYPGLTADYARLHGAKFLVRGLRAVSDFDSELRIALTNKKLNPELETVFLATGLEYLFLSSSGVKEIARFGGNVQDFVPPLVAQYLRQRYLSQSVSVD